MVVSENEPPPLNSCVNIYMGSGCTKLHCGGRLIYKNDMRVAPLLPTASLERRLARNAVSLTSICCTHLLRTVTSSVIAITSGTTFYRYNFIVHRNLLWSLETTIEAISLDETRRIFLDALKNVFCLGQNFASYSF